MTEAPEPIFFCRATRNASALPSSDFHLTQNGNRHFTLCLQGRGDFHASKNGSIGANIAESEHAQSKADFMSKLYISLKEANETKYWLTLLYKADYMTDTEFESIMKDVRIIIGTLVKYNKEDKR